MPVDAISLCRFGLHSREPVAGSRSVEEEEGEMFGNVEEYL
jgi:hypothetical protein